ncbi:MAG: hypothetical protein WC665_11700 [Sulfurimonas sp.]|jgi:hypothetical protein
METSTIFAAAITTIFALYFIGQYFSLSRSVLKTSEANRVLKGLANLNNEPSALASMTSTQGLALIKKRNLFSKQSNKQELIPQSKPTGIGWA